MRRIHYAWIMAALTFLVLLASAGVRATPGILIVPLEHEFGWSRATISSAIAVNLALFGMVGPFAASLMDRWGVRRLVTAALALLSATVFTSTFMHSSWHLFLLWGGLVGLGTGATSLVLAAFVVNRWFDSRRGLVLGLLTAANATGQLVFLPTLASLTAHRGWRSAALLVAAVAALISAMSLAGMRDTPDLIGLRPFGADRPSVARPAQPPLAALAFAARSREFWILAGTFFICGASTNGLIATHLIPACMDHGISEVAAAGLLATMGVFDLVGTTASGWLTDRFDSRTLLFFYYGLRGLALLYLPHSLQSHSRSLSLFAVFYGLDWIATVPPTVRLVSNAFGHENAGVIYGWIGAAHQLGASFAALAAGVIRTNWGDYRLAFWSSGLLCLGAALLLVGTRQAGSLSTLNARPSTCRDFSTPGSAKPAK